jgi:PAS domain-containing protein
VAEALHSSEERFRAVFEGAPTGIGIAGLDGTVLEANDARHPAPVAALR